MPEEYLTNPQEKHTFIYVSTIQRMAINLLGKDAPGNFEHEVDTVEDKVMFRVGNDYQKPEDYLKLFETFVKNNPEHIEAIEVLLSSPSKWNTDVLDDLRDKLKKSDFPEKYLQQGYELVYKKPLADIISMVKHASDYEAPILTAKERVEKVMAEITGKYTFTDEQMNWLSYIKEHLIENLAVSQEDFEKCYGKDPNGRAKRRDQGEDGRFRKFSFSEIKDRGFNLDITWLKDENLEDPNSLPEPQLLVADAITELSACVDELQLILDEIETEAAE